MKMWRLNAVLLLCLTALVAPAFGENTVRPGTINYVEGSVELAGNPISSRSVRSAEVNPGQVLTTTQGKAEILLTPGIFLRLNDNSALQMISPDLTHTAVELEHGRAMVEVDEIHPQNQIRVVVKGVTTQLLKTGLYAFDANRQTLEVFDGKAAVLEGDNRWTVTKGHREFALGSNDENKPQKFNVNAARDDLYNWSSLRSEYLAESNSQIAGEYAGVPGFVPGWYWDPYFFDYTFIGAGPLFSPFGWGFYPPWYYGGGFYGGYGYRYPRVYAGRGFSGERGFHGGVEGGFHGGGGFGGGGFGGGGFHGGGGGHR